jgi:hypothetical protein
MNTTVPVLVVSSLLPKVVDECEKERTGGRKWLRSDVWENEQIMARRSTLPCRPVSLRLRLYWKIKRKREPPPPSLGGGGVLNTGCVLQTANQEQTSCIRQKKKCLRVKTHHKCLAVTFPPLCRTAAVCQIVLLLCREDERVSSRWWCWFPLRIVSNSRLLIELGFGRKRSWLPDVLSRYLPGVIDENNAKPQGTRRLCRDSNQEIVEHCLSWF